MKDNNIDAVTLLRLMVNGGLHVLPDGKTVLHCDKSLFELATILVKNQEFNIKNERKTT